jgi:hypothetical protein
MAKFIVAVAILGAIAFAWHKGWIGEWLGKAADSGMDTVKRTQRDATKARPIDPGPSEEKK